MQDMGNGKGLGADVGFRGKLLSGGEKQRLCLARTLLMKRPILLLDEPISNQDVGSVQSIAGMLSEETVPLTPDAPPVPLTVLATTHNLVLLDHFTHVAYLSNGRVVESGPKDEVLAKKGHVYRRLVSQSGLFIDRRGRAIVTIERLRQVWLFSNAPDESLRSLIHCLSTRTCNADEELFKEKTDADSMFLVVSGQIEMRVPRKGGTGYHRTVWQAGDEIGVNAVVDTTMCWPGTAVVSSLKAVLLELPQTELEALIETDVGLSESVGETIAALKRMRSAQSLHQLWSFYGAPLETLEALGASLEPIAYDEGAVLCDTPRDPCATMSFVVLGSVNVLRGEANGDELSMVEKLGHGSSFGMMEVLPVAEPGTTEAVIRSRQGVLKKVRTNEYTILLEIQREQLAELMIEQPALQEVRSPRTMLFTHHALLRRTMLLRPSRPHTRSYAPALLHPPCSRSPDL